MVRDDGSEEEFICWATLKRKGQVHGWIQRFGFARQMVSEDSELVAQMEPVLPKKPAPKAVAAPKPAPVKQSPVKKTTSTRKASTKKASSKASK